MNSFNLKVFYCKPCGFEKHAKRLSADLNSQFSGKLENLELEPTEKIGSFEVYLDKELIFSKMRKGHLPHPGEIEQIIMKKIVGTNG